MMKASMQQHFDQTPYLNFPLNFSHLNDANALFVYSWTIGYYRCYGEVVASEGKWILDAGCGSGITTLGLAEANPGAHIVAIDLSPRSVEIAQERLAHHGFDRVQFHTLPLEAIESLGIAFDFIHCHETLYLIPDTLKGLTALHRVLKPGGIMRLNLHSQYHREGTFRSQQLFQNLGLNHATITADQKISTVRSVMNSLRDGVELKRKIWSNTAKSDEMVSSNQLLFGDRGFTVPQTLHLLQQSHLSFVSMTNWLKWQVTPLFQHPDRVPEYIDWVLSLASPAQQCALFELLHPIHRLLDFWCISAPPEDIAFPLGFEPLEDTDSCWNSTATFVLSPHLRTAGFEQALRQSLQHLAPLPLSPYFGHLDSSPTALMAGSMLCLQLLWAEPLSFDRLLAQGLLYKPYDWDTGTPCLVPEFRSRLQTSLRNLHRYGLVMVDHG